MKITTVVLALFIMTTVGTSLAMEDTTLIYRESTAQNHEEMSYVFKE